MLTESPDIYPVPANYQAALEGSIFIFTYKQLKKLSETALQQINDKKYETELMSAGVRTIYKAIPHRKDAE